MHALPLVGETQELDQLALRFQVVEELADPLEIVDRHQVLEQIGLTAHQQAAVLVLRAGPGGEAGGNDLLRQCVQLGLGLGKVGLDTGLGLADGQAAHVMIDVVRGLHKGGRRQIARHLDDAILHGLVIADEHHQGLAGLERHELDMLQAHVLLFGQHQAGAV